MTLQRTPITYEAPGGVYESVLVSAPAAGEQPGLLLFPNFLGIKEADLERAEQFAAEGFKVLVVDVYGAGKRGHDRESGGALMAELVTDRTLMRDKLLAHLARLQAVPGVRPGRVGAVGYCLGGKCVLDLARAGADFAGVAVHGVYDAPPFPNAAIKASLLICHGWNDPICPPDSVAALGQELTAGDADWSMIAFSRTGHAFTDKTRPLDEQRTFGYVAFADEETWNATLRFFARAL